ncbi:MAG: putative DNA binding domain-containing protein [Planctomycetes bacterium]|nr:putative DNA binding domain-containing protein [Planctomycetota bacterium]
MPQPDLDTLLRTETDRVEWKESPSAGEDVLQAVAALANDLGNTGRPGFLVLGVTKQGQVLGIESRGGALDKQQQALSSRLTSTKLWPAPSTALHLCSRASKHLIVVEVAPYPVPPAVAVNGTAFVRHGSTTRRASPADLLRLNERRPEAQRPFDSRIVQGASIDDLDASVLRGEYEGVKSAAADREHFPSFPEWMAVHKQLGLMKDGAFLPFGATLLLHGVGPQDVLPGASIEFVRFGGSSIDATVVLRKTITGSLPAQLDALWSQISAQLTSRPVPQAGIRSEFLPDYPIEALKEFARNMVQHRLYEGTHAPARVEWYEDRVEFSNPGGPFGRASEGEFGEHADYRNPLITNGLLASGYVEKFGRGVRVARVLLEKNGNPPLEVETDGYTRVIVRKRP